jgi:NAD(P)-dependent dehydrogenase (short-subunit alcohol dehydrogenase family)
MVDYRMFERARYLAKAVLEGGWNAVVTVRDPGTAQDIATSYPDTAVVLRLDVTDKTQIPKAVRQAEARFGGVDVLVNNAGHGYRSAVE